MVKRTRTEIAREIDKPLSEPASTRSPSRKFKSSTDEVLAALANAYENRRARQVFEWERAQPAYLRRTA
ncbi:MAG TPA: hypothetical protein PKD26_09045 [Pyrinomonadaceae bacterium]|nr:hypothetical protein [Pyrinomonadaceae bacterium]